MEKRTSLGNIYFNLPKNRAKYYITKCYLPSFMASSLSNEMNMWRLVWSLWPSNVLMIKWLTFVASNRIKLYTLHTTHKSLTLSVIVTIHHTSFIRTTNNQRSHHCWPSTTIMCNTSSSITLISLHSIQLPLSQPLITYHLI